MLKKRLFTTAMIFSMINPFKAMANDVIPEAVPRIADYALENSALEAYNTMEEQIMTLAQLIEAEAETENLNGKILVGNVVVNRIRSPKYPNTLNEVIYQKGQFQVVRNGKFDRVKNNVSVDSYVAALLAMNGEGDPGILYFGTSRRNGHGHWKYGNHWFSY